MRNKIRGFVIGGFIASGLGALAVNIPFTFSAGSAIKASDINANFGSLKTAVDALEGSKFKLPFQGTSAAFTVLSIENNGNGNAIRATSINSDAIFAESTNTTGISGLSQKAIGVYGTSLSTATNTPGVLGINNATTGQVVGVIGKGTESPIGSGVAGFGKVTGGYFEASGGPSGGFEPTGVFGVANQNMGTGVQGIGATWGGKFKGSIGLSVEGSTGITVKSKDAGSTLYLQQEGVGALINAFLPNSKRFIVDSSGNISTPGNLVANGVTYTSDRNAKTNFSSINALEVLSKVTQLNISRWNYKTEASSLQHVGPMAQDFHAAFGLNGKDDKHLSAVDMQGVAFAAIQGLNQKLEQKTAKIADLESKLAMLESRLAALEKK
jgi:Chaperone of endosialidase